MRVGLFPYQPGGNPYQSLFASSLESADLEVRRIPPRKLLPLHFALSHTIDLLHIDWPHDWYSGRNVITTLVKRMMYFQGLRKLSEFPCVWTAHNIRAHDAIGNIDESRMIQALLDSCSGIMVLSKTAKSALLEEYRIKVDTVISVVPHGHYIDSYPNDVSRGSAREELGLADAGNVVLSLGRILPYKGADQLITAFSEVARKGDVLIIAGTVSDSDSLDHLKQLSELRCPDGAQILIHAGFVPDERLQYYFNSCDVVALPFQEILNSGSLLLAMSFGKCVVAPRIGSIPEIAYRTGFIDYDKNDQHGLATAIEQSFNCSDRATLEKKILAFTREKYGWEQVGTKVREMYSAILSNRK